MSYAKLKTDEELDNEFILGIEELEEEAEKEELINFLKTVYSVGRGLQDLGLTSTEAKDVLLDVLKRTGNN
mgnify:CR=1 FL=1